MVSARATSNPIRLGQVVVDTKSNEITAIPKLLKILEISASIVTIDAIVARFESWFEFRRSCNRRPPPDSEVLRGTLRTRPLNYVLHAD